MRGRRERDRGHHAEDGLGPPAWIAPRPHRLHHRRRPGLRLHQRLPRRGQLDRDRRLHPGAQPHPGRGLGRVLQLRRRVRVRRERGADDRQGHRAPGERGRARDPGGADRRDRLEPDHLVRRASRPAPRTRSSAGWPARRSPGPASGSLVPAGLARRRVFIVLSPLLGLALGVHADGRRDLDLSPRVPSRVDRLFRRLQLVSAAFYSLGHGTNDAQKTMGIIAGLLFATGHLGTGVPRPLWVILSAHAAIGLGTLAGGWRIVKTMGMGITRLKPVGRLLRGDRRGAHAHRHGGGRDPGQHDPHDHRGHRGRGRHDPPLRRALGHRRADRLGLDPHDPGGGAHRRGELDRSSAG